MSQLEQTKDEAQKMDWNEALKQALKPANRIDFEAIESRVRLHNTIVLGKAEKQTRLDNCRLVFQLI